MESIIADYLNNRQASKKVRYTILTLLEIFIQFIFISGIVSVKEIYAIIFCALCSIVFLIIYIYSIIKMKRYGYVRKNQEC